MSRSNDQTTKEQILRAATLELAARGWGGLRTRAVAERAGVNKGLVHYHFGSMDELRFEVIAHAMTEAVDESAAAVLSAPTLAAGVREFCRHLSQFSADRAQGAVLIEAMMHVPREPRLQDLMLRAVEAYEASLATRIENDVAAGSLPPTTDATGLATALAAALDGLAMHAYVRAEADFVAAGEALASLFAATTRTKG